MVPKCGLVPLTNPPCPKSLGFKPWLFAPTGLAHPILGQGFDHHHLCKTKKNERCVRRAFSYSCTPKLLSSLLLFFICTVPSYRIPFSFPLSFDLGLLPSLLVSVKLCQRGPCCVSLSFGLDNPPGFQSLRPFTPHSHVRCIFSLPCSSSHPSVSLQQCLRS